MSESRKEFSFAMTAAMHTWRGTSISEGALAILDHIYNDPHSFNDFGDSDNRCSRCGRNRHEYPHN